MFWLIVTLLKGWDYRWRLYGRFRFADSEWKPSRCRDCFDGVAAPGLRQGLPDPAQAKRGAETENWNPQVNQYSFLSNQSFFTGEFKDIEFVWKYWHAHSSEGILKSLFNGYTKTLFF